ncbi:energy-coupling factor transporter transmembrane component T family protein [Saccharolobus shibatae]|uniref:Transmembrane component SS1135 of energizing module of predicted ECF transporter n=1 Tax=Saccharolobus shibatae TaxID=2286 RepID=A0A8F5GWZ2_9CREN|nr:energy-coupling factor transporter transmembrane protein EcfT [Saccharolobus shibatae]QXJ32535.1 Transmembrane component of energizing module of predicted ECF transporter [Saccharolobus shibatae]QXJ35696.1 Transmembrane component SS1135 of energizing module of predicted ECF transporter [Saccharolobus shibatae]
MNNLVEQIVSWVIVLYGSAVPALFVIFLIGITGLREITRYETGNTFLYKLNPVIKLVLTIVVMTVAATTIWWIGAILTLILLLSYLTLNEGVRKFGYAFFLTLSTILGGTWSIAPYTPPSILQLAFPNVKQFTVIWTFPSYFQVMGYEQQLTLEALIYGLQTAFRVAPVLLSALLFITTTTGSDIFRMFTKIKIPIAITFSVLVGIRMIPRIFELLDTSVKMQYIRGLGYGKPKIISSLLIVYAIFEAIIPTMVYLFRGAKNLAISADTRGFRAYPSRTSLVELKFTKLDYYGLVIIVVLIVLAIVANLLGFGRTIPYVGA